MALLEPGLFLEHMGLTLKGLLSQEAWGEVWRAHHQQHGFVILALYSGEKGEALFAAIRERLQKWNAAAAGCPQMARIIDESFDSAIPYVMTEDPGGPTLREAVESKGAFTIQATVAFVNAAALAMRKLTGEGIMPLASSPDRFVCSDEEERGWVLLPTVLFHKDHWDSMELAHPWAPPELIVVPRPEASNPDSHAVGLMAIAARIGRLKDLPKVSSDLKAAMKAGKLAMILGNALVPAGGAYCEARSLALLIERYTRHEMEIDLQDEVRIAKGKKPLGIAKKKGDGVRKLLGVVRVLSFVGSLGLVGAAAYFMFFTVDRVTSPRGLHRLYFEAVVDRDIARAEQYVLPEARGRTQELLDHIVKMEGAGRIKRFEAATPAELTDPTRREVRADLLLVDDREEPFLRVKYEMEKRPDDSFALKRIAWTEMYEIPGTGLKHADDPFHMEDRQKAIQKKIDEAKAKKAAARGAGS